MSNYCVNCETTAIRAEKAEKALLAAAVAMGSPKDADRLAEALGYVLRGYRERAEKAEAEVERLRDDLSAAHDDAVRLNELRLLAEAEVARLRETLEWIAEEYRDSGAGATARNALRGGE